MLSRCTGGRVGRRMQDGFRSISGEILDASSPIWYTEAPEKDEDQVRTGWPWPYFQGHEGHLRCRHYGGICKMVSISEEVFDQYTETPRQIEDQVGTRWPWPHRRSFRMAALARWFPPIYRKKYLTYPHQIWYTEAPKQVEAYVWTSWPWPYYQDNEGHLRSFKMVFAQYLKKYLTYTLTKFSTQKHRGKRRPSSSSWPWILLKVI